MTQPPNPPWGQQQNPYQPPGPQPMPAPPMPYAPRPPKKKPKVLMIVLAAIILPMIGITSCVALLARSGSSASTDPVFVPASTAAPSSTPPVDEPAEQDDPSDDSTLQPVAKAKIGDVGVYKDRISVSVTSATMAKGPDGPFLLIKAKIKNGSGKRFDPSEASVFVTYGASGQSAERVSVAGKTNSSFGATLAPKKSKTAKFGFKLTKKQAETIQVGITPDADRYRPVIFKGSAD